MCMDKSGKIQCRGIWSLARHTRSYKEKKIIPVFILLGVNNDTIKMTTRINQHQKCQKLKKNVDDKDLAPHRDLYLQLDRIIDHLPYSAQGKVRYSLHTWVRIEIHKDVIYFLTFNKTFVCCVTVHFILMSIMKRWFVLVTYSFLLKLSSASTIDLLVLWHMQNSMM